MRKSGRFSLKKKTIILIVSIIVLISLAAGLLCAKGLSDISRNSYTSRSKELSATAAALVNPEYVKTLRDQVLTIYRETEDPVSSEEWGSPEFDAYLERFSAITETEEFRSTVESMRIIQDTNHLMAVYLVWFDLETKSTLYLADAAYEDSCLPGTFDAIMYEVDFRAMENPADGIEPDITNTEEYGWTIAAGSPVFLDGELVAFAGADISMNDVMNQQNHLLLIAAITLTVLALVFILIGILLIDRAIIRPINTLSDVSEKYCQGESSAIRHDFSKLQIHTGDEIETLSNSMKQMEKNINEHITRILETTQTLITTQHRADEMDRIANIDELTKVRNKRAYDLEMERVNQEIREGKTDVGLAMIDLNYLKTINDTYGHEKGDETIRALCRVICRVFQHSPVFRIGGDEFVIILEKHDLEDIDRLKEELHKELLQLQNSPDPWDRVSAADGYAFFDPEKDKSMESVFKRADEAMYARKKEMKAIRND